MLEKKYRITKKEEILKLFKMGRRYNTDGVLSFIRSNADEQNTRAVAIVGKKFSQKAALRNKQRRIFQAALKDTIPHTKAPMDILISYQIQEKMIPYIKAREIILKHITLFLKEN